MTGRQALECEVVVTSSGARAILDRCTGEVMHPVVGPLVEAERLYVGPSRLAQRLVELATDPLVLLDVGLGAGSNAAAALRAAQAAPLHSRRLSIVSFDRSTVALELSIGEGHPADFGFDDARREAAQTLLRQGQSATPRAQWRLRLGELPESLSREPEAAADIVFWDPFSPLANPKLWDLGAFTALRRACRAGATVHTYSGATRVRAALLLAGFSVGFGEAIRPGREATVAALDPAALERPLGHPWLERLQRSSAPFPVDAPRDALERIQALPQFRG